jgi:hypothetical protein
MFSITIYIDNLIFNGHPGNLLDTIIFALEREFQVTNFGQLYRLLGHQITLIAT